MKKSAAFGISKDFFLSFPSLPGLRYQLQEGKYFNPITDIIRPKLPLVGTGGAGAESHTIVIEAVRDLVTDYHANAAVVERFGLAFTEERRLEDPCWEH